MTNETRVVDGEFSSLFKRGTRKVLPLFFSGYHLLQLQQSFSTMKEIELKRQAAY